MKDTTQNQDHLVRAVGDEGKLHAFAVCSKNLAQALITAQEAAPTAAAALTRLATATLLMGGTIKGRDQISVQIKGQGLLGNLIAIADAKGNVRATLDHPKVDFPRKDNGCFDVGFVIGSGDLIVSKTLGEGTPYQSIVPLVTGEIGDDLVQYFHSSEQKPSAMGLGERIDKDTVEAAGGFLIQAFPGVDESTLIALEERIAAMPPLSELFFAGETPTDILRRLLPDLKVLDQYPVAFTCTCSRDRYERILITLGAKELTSLLDEQQGAELQCHFCNVKYNFGQEDLKILISLIEGSSN